MTYKVQYCLNVLLPLVEAKLFFSKAHLSPAAALGAVWLSAPQSLMFFCCLLSRHSACHSDRPLPEAASPLSDLYVPPLGFSSGLHVA